MLVAFSILFILSCGGVIYALNQSGLRISRVSIYGADQSLGALALSAMRGTYFGIIPRDSTAFFPASRIREDILSAHPDIAAVSLFRDGLEGLSIKTSERAPIARWCGLSPTEGVEAYCYVFDASGLIFSAAASTTQTMNKFVLYAPLEGGVLEPLRATIAHQHMLPAAFDFARQLDTFGSRVSSVVIHGDEVDDILESSTRVTYVLGNEQNAFTALISARGDFSLADGSLDYVDLRFDGKVYLKKKVDSTQKTVNSR
jgi:hypothetical protein